MLPSDVMLGVEQGRLRAPTDRTGAAFFAVRELRTHLSRRWRLVPDRHAVHAAAAHQSQLKLGRQPWDKAVSCRLAGREVRFVFTTGYGADALDPGYLHYPRCEKPFDVRMLFQALTRS